MRLGAMLATGVATLAVGLAPGMADAAQGFQEVDPIFDPADAQELADTLNEAYQAQGVCYGWDIDVDDAGRFGRSAGSNFGVGQPLEETPEASGCDTTVEFQADITWTSEISEAEDSASYQVVSTPSGPTTADLDNLAILRDDGLVSDDVDLEVYKAVAALPLLAADAGVAEPMEANPAPPTVGGDARPTNTPGSDFWRQSGDQILLGSLFVFGGAVFAWFVFRQTRRERARRAQDRPAEPAAPQPPTEHLPRDWQDQTRPGAPATPPAQRRPTDHPGPETRPEG